ncbi:MAG: hypothetical protein WA364_10460 [Candidatus Nitrosopolaris sp.]
MSSDNKQFLMNQLIWMGTHSPYAFIADTISNINSGTFLLFPLKRRIIVRMGGISNSMMGAGMFSPTSTYEPIKYY